MTTKTIIPYISGIYSDIKNTIIYYMVTKPVLDDIQLNCFLLGCILGLVINYPKIIHGCDSRDVVRSKFVENGVCYRFKPRVVACGWHQGFPTLTNAAS